MIRSAACSVTVTPCHTGHGCSGAGGGSRRARGLAKWVDRRCQANGCGVNGRLWLADAASTLRSMPGADGQRTYEIRTYGCQMNMHDSERLAGLLEEAGYHKPAADAEPDVVVFNTC